MYRCLTVVWAGLLLAGAVLVSGCGMSRETKQLTGRVFGYNGVMDEYMRVTTDVLKTHLEIVRAFEAKDPTIRLKATGADGAVIEVGIAEYRAALEVLLTYPEKFMTAYHAVNDAVQADSGFSGFTEQLLRTLSADKFWDLTKPR